MTDERPPPSRPRWRGFVIVRDYQGERTTLDGLRPHPWRASETIYDFAVDPPYPVTFASTSVAQVWIDLMPPDLRALCSIEEN